LPADEPGAALIAQAIGDPGRRRAGGFHRFFIPPSCGNPRCPAL